eukprot:g21271.t1
MGCSEDLSTYLRPTRTCFSSVSSARGLFKGSTRKRLRVLRGSSHGVLPSSLATIHLLISYPFSQRHESTHGPTNVLGLVAETQQLFLDFEIHRLASSDTDARITRALIQSCV